MASPDILETKDSCVGVVYEKFPKGNTDLAGSFFTGRDMNTGGQSYVNKAVNLVISILYLYCTQLSFITGPLLV